MKEAPKPAAIRRATPLTEMRAKDPISACTVCARPFEKWESEIMLYRECDEFDRPKPGDDALVYVGYDGSCGDACERKLQDHPRLYVEEQGLPGTFPRLCGGCVYRDGLACTHRMLKANGGPGLRVVAERDTSFRIQCPDSGCHFPVRDAKKCDGRSEYLKLLPPPPPHDLAGVHPEEDGDML